MKALNLIFIFLATITFSGCGISNPNTRTSLFNGLYESVTQNPCKKCKKFHCDCSHEYQSGYGYFYDYEAPHLLYDLRIEREIGEPPKYKRPYRQRITKYE